MKLGKKKLSILFLLVLPFIYSGLLFALTIKDASIEELALESDLIVRGTIKSSVCEWENEALKRIETIIQLEAKDYLKGSGEKNLEITQMGGKIDDIEDIIFGTPKLEKDDEVLLFLVNKNNNYVIHSIALGSYRIELNNNLQEVAINDLSNVQLISDESNKVVSSDYTKKNYLLSELILQIDSSLK